jgi:hypothetical protein
MKTLNKSFVVEAALAAMFAAAFVMPAVAQDAAPKGGDQPMPMKKAAGKKHGKDKVHCFGINSCKGKSECAVEGKSSCSGKNSCKGEGWVSVASAKKCTSKKGTVVMSKEAAAPMAAPAAAPASK